ncbi:helix-turn-helix transcriptional regulator [Nostocaceae cyanobacterium CENA369]|uniref:Helix-turn-helix transcriptional regulator n=1 Tax=Dendronalium phyllosphericum CENA369 TaxID=1725256 RepID=A0A8J7LJ81_9NOST|nr:helix-turn-helix domain-containing protein [Dendronalium phyllosphericum]MBH8577324.1 helix-turn-helix transcriptional regulator [Dendronalium phyllosphericum CENA369]
MAQSPKILNAHPYLRQTLELVSDKWVTAIIYVLSQGTKRYGELHREIGEVSQRMLTRTLRDLERDGLVRREVYSTNPPTVEYSLTSLGETLVEPLRLLCQWSIEHFQEVETARKSKDNHR